MTDITLGLPIGGFYWRGGVPGPLCGATVSWACDYASTEPVAIPPFIDFFGPNVVVTNILPECEGVPSYVSPGVLTLTPTVTCPHPDSEQPPIVTVLDPLYLTITEGTCGSSAPEPPCVPTICPFPENPGFESGLTGWSTYNASVESTIVNSGTQSVKLAQYGYVRQTKSIVCPDPPNNFDVTFFAYCANASSSVRLQVIQYNGTTVVDNYILGSIDVFPLSQWVSKQFSPAWHADTDTIRIQLEANHPDIYLDDIAVSFCP